MLVRRADMVLYLFEVSDDTLGNLVAIVAAGDAAAVSRVAGLAAK